MFPAFQSLCFSLFFMSCCVEKQLQYNIEYRSGDNDCYQLMTDFKWNAFNILSLHAVFTTSSTKSLCILESTFLVLDWKELNSKLTSNEEAGLLALVQITQANIVEKEDPLCGPPFSHQSLTLGLSGKAQLLFSARAFSSEILRERFEQL